jgi:hypothetical protein
MKNIAINTIKYTGIVTLSQYTGSKKVKIAQLHNAGGESLFRFLAKCLVGDFTEARLIMPTKIMLVKLKKPGSLAEGFERLSTSSGFTYKLTKPEIVYTKDSSSSRVRYSFVIAKEEVVNIDKFENLYMGLYTDDVNVDSPNDYAAICKLDIAKSSIANASLAIDWELVISNIEAKS